MSRIKLSGFVHGEGSEDYTITTKLDDANFEGKVAKNAGHPENDSDLATAGWVKAQFKETIMTGDGSIHFKGDVDGHGLIGQPVQLDLSFPLDVKGEKITNVADAIDETDAINKRMLKNALGNITLSGVINGAEDETGSILTTYPLTHTVQSDTLERFWDQDLSTYSKFLNRVIPGRQYIDEVTDGESSLNIYRHPGMFFRIISDMPGETNNILMSFSNFGSWELSISTPVSLVDKPISTTYVPVYNQHLVNKAYCDANAGGGTLNLTGVIQGSGDISGPIEVSYSDNQIFTLSSYDYQYATIGSDSIFRKREFVHGDGGIIQEKKLNPSFQGFCQDFLPGTSYSFFAEEDSQTKSLLYKLDNTTSSWVFNFSVPVDLVDQPISTNFEPTEDQHLVNKAYCDAHSGGGGSFPSHLEFQGDVLGTMVTSEGVVQLHLSNPTDMRGKQIKNCLEGTDPDDVATVRQITFHPGQTHDCFSIFDVEETAEGTTNIQTNKTKFKFSNKKTFGNLRSSILDTVSYGENAAIYFNGHTAAIASPGDTVLGIRSICMFQDTDMDTAKYLKSYVSNTGDYVVANQHDGIHRLEKSTKKDILSKIKKIKIKEVEHLTSNSKKKGKKKHKSMFLDGLKDSFPELLEKDENKNTYVNTTKLLYTLVQAVQELEAKTQSL